MSAAAQASWIAVPRLFAPEPAECLEAICGLTSPIKITADAGVVSVLARPPWGLTPQLCKRRLLWLFAILGGVRVTGTQLVAVQQIICN